MLNSSILVVDKRFIRVVDDLDHETTTSSLMMSNTKFALNQEGQSTDEKSKTVEANKMLVNAVTSSNNANNSNGNSQERSVSVILRNINASSLIPVASMDFLSKRHAFLERLSVIQALMDEQVFLSFIPYSVPGWREKCQNPD